MLCSAGCHCIYYFFVLLRLFLLAFIFFFNDTATTEIYTLSLHDALPIFRGQICHCEHFHPEVAAHSYSEQLLRDENRSEERFSRNAETDLVCRLLLEKKNK